MNVLIVSAQFPYPPHSGFAARTYHLARQVAARHAVTLLAYAEPEQREAVAALAQELSVRVVERGHASVGSKRVAQALSIASPRPYACRSVYSDAMQQAIRELCAAHVFDLIQVESSVLGAFAFPRSARVVLDEHNVEYEVFLRMSEGERGAARRAFNRLEHARFRRFEQRLWARVDACVVTSDREAPIVRTHAPSTPVAVVPNGVDLEYFRPTPGEPEPQTLLFNGILTYRPNLDAAQYLIDEIWPLVLRRCPNARLTIVGRASDADRRRLRRPGVVLTGEVPDIRPYLRRSSVIAVPLRIGGGTRLKVVEGLALGKALVSTSLGCEGLAVRDREHLLIADDAEAFAAKVAALFDDAGMRAALGRGGRCLIEQRYSWELAGERLEEVYRRVNRDGRLAIREAVLGRPAGSSRREI